jgi:hypothetical protein
MDKDLKEMFREKNKMIIISNLKYDLEKNINSLLDTITNIFNLEFDTAIKNIISIHEDSGIYHSDKFITQTINDMKIKSYSQIDKYLQLKKQTLEEKIDHLEFEESSLNHYYEQVFQTTKDFKEQMHENSVISIKEQGIELLNQYILENVDDDKEKLAISRVNDYLENRLYGKLETKIHMEIMLRDNNLINKAKESYLRFQDISSRTSN